MKKATVIIFLFCYILSAIGITVSSHYCGGKLASVSLNLTGEGKCKCGNKKMKKNCCKTKINTYSIKDTQNATPQMSADFHNFFSLLSINFSTSNTLFHSSEVEEEFYYHQRPPSQIDQPLYLLNRVFRI